ncbi:MAG: hypothetical protein R2759_20660 [Bacteroidales bacterium]
MVVFTEGRCRPLHPQYLSAALLLVPRKAPSEVITIFDSASLILSAGVAENPANTMGEWLRYGHKPA